MITPKVITEPAFEPINLSEAKMHLRVDSTAEDDLILGYIRSARKYLEWRTGRAFLSQTLEMVFDRFPASTTILRLPRATPLTSVTSVLYKDSDGTEATWSSAEYILDNDNLPGGIRPIYGGTWPSFTAYPVNAVRIRYVCGDNSSPLVIPDDIKALHYLVLERFFDHRSNLFEAARTATAMVLEPGIEALISQLQVEHVF